MFLIGLGIHLVLLAITALPLILFTVIGLAIGLITHPLCILMLIFRKLASIIGGFALIPSVLLWFAADHNDENFVLYFWASIAVAVISGVVFGLIEWFF